MKKILIYLWLIVVVLFWVLYIGLYYFIGIIHGNDFDLLEKSISGLFIAFFSMTIFILISYYSVIPRSKYLEKNDSAKPAFKDTCSSIINVPHGFDFSRLKTLLASRGVITFSDDDANMLKFRRKVNSRKVLDAAAWLKLDSDTGKIQSECFPMVYNKKVLAEKLHEEIEKWIKQTD
jgi:hypothetical protein